MSAVAKPISKKKRSAEENAVAALADSQLTKEQIIELIETERCLRSATPGELIGTHQGRFVAYVKTLLLKIAPRMLANQPWEFNYGKQMFLMSIRFVHTFALVWWYIEGVMVHRGLTQQQLDAIKGTEAYNAAALDVRTFFNDERDKAKAKIENVVIKQLKLPPRRSGENAFQYRERIKQETPGIDLEELLTGTIDVPIYRGEGKEYMQMSRIEYHYTMAEFNLAEVFKTDRKLGNHMMVLIHRMLPYNKGYTEVVARQLLTDAEVNIGNKPALATALANRVLRANKEPPLPEEYAKGPSLNSTDMLVEECLAELERGDLDSQD